MKNIERIVLGYKGEIGSAIADIFKANICIDLNDYVINGKKFENDVLNKIDWNKKTSILHVTIPFTDNFINIVSDWMLRLKPMITIIHTTSKPGATREIFKQTNLPTVHCPINGRHPNMKSDIQKYDMFVGAIEETTGQKACEYIEFFGLDTYLCQTPEITELSKIASTDLMRVNIEFYQQMKKKINEMGINWAEYIAFMKNIMEKGDKLCRIYQRAGEIDTPLSGKHCISVNKDLL